MRYNLGLKLPLPQQPSKELELAAQELFDAIAGKSFRLKSATSDAESFKTARIEVHLARDRYHRARGNSHGGQLMWLADAVCSKISEIVNRGWRQAFGPCDAVCSKISEIVNLNPSDWNNYRRGQQFRRLNDLLIHFGRELWKQRRK